MTTLESYFTKENLPQHPQVDVGDYPEDTRDAIRAFCDIYGHRPPKKKSAGFALWIKAARELNDACGEFPVRDVLEPIFIQWNKDIHTPNVRAYDVVGPMSVMNIARGQAAKMRTVQVKPDVVPYFEGLAIHD